MNKGIRGLLVATFLIGSSLTAYADVSAYDYEHMSPEAAAQLIKEKQSKNNIIPNVSVTPESAKQWAGVGKEIAEGISATAKGLSLEVNDFVNTPVGYISMGLLIWYMLGHTLFNIFLGIAIWICLGMVIWKSFKTFHIPRVEVVDGKKNYVYYAFKSNEAKAASGFAHAAVFSALSIIMMIIIL